jgi:TolB protein
MRGLPAIAAVFALVALPAGAGAAYPGANGKLAYEKDVAVTGAEIHVMNQDGTGDVNLGPGDAPSWSPDGSEIASNYGGVLWVMNADGSNRHQIVGLNANGEVRFPTWSPTGDKLAFERENCVDEGDVSTCTSILETVNAGGTGETTILSGNNPSPAAPAWSPDGTKIAFGGYPLYTNFGGGDIYTIRPDGSNMARLTNTPDADDSFPDWSPDGRKLVATNDAGGIYTMNPDGTGVTTLGQPDGGSPSWSPDGRRMTFFRNGQIYVMNADGSARVQLTNADFNLEPNWQPIPYTGYARPRGAGPFFIHLVPAYKPCVGTGNRSHGAPLSFPSCAPPQQASDFLTVGTSDSNGQPNKSIGSVNYAPRLSPADFEVQAAITDVRNKVDLSDYTGSLQDVTSIRVTDRYNGPSLTDPATVQDIPLPIGVPCAGTTDTTVGSTCTVSTSANAVIPGMVVAQKRMIIELGQVRIYDGGADGDPATGPQGTVFMDQGIFVP